MLLSQSIILKSFITNKYLFISKEHGISFDQSDIKKSDILKLRYEGKYITLKSKYGYISLNNGNIDFNEEIGNNERFEIEYLDENWFRLKANNGFYISVQNDGKLNINQKNIDNNEKLLMNVTQKESVFEFLDF